MSTRPAKQNAAPSGNPSQPHLSRGDQCFDDRAEHLKNNIYGSAKGQLRLNILQRDLASLTQAPRALTVLDAGCGAGWMSEWALSHGHHVTACDSSAVMIAEINARLGEHPHFCAQQATIQTLAPQPQYDVIFCHAVLEWVENQAELLDKLSALLKPNGRLSLMFYNAWAREMAQLVYGNFDFIDRGYRVRQRVKLNPHYPAFPNEVKQALEDRGLTLLSRSGIRIFYDIMRHRQHYQTLADDIMRHELRVSQQFPYWQMGRYVHFWAQK